MQRCQPWSGFVWCGVWCIVLLGCTPAAVLPTTWAQCRDAAEHLLESVHLDAWLSQAKVISVEQRPAEFQPLYTFVFTTIGRDRIYVEWDWETQTCSQRLWFASSPRLPGLSDSDYVMIDRTMREVTIPPEEIIATIQRQYVPDDPDLELKFIELFADPETQARFALEAVWIAQIRLPARSVYQWLVFDAHTGALHETFDSLE